MVGPATATPTPGPTGPPALAARAGTDHPGPGRPASSAPGVASPLTPALPVVPSRRARRALERPVRRRRRAARAAAAGLLVGLGAWTVWGPNEVSLAGAPLPTAPLPTAPLPTALLPTIADAPLGLLAVALAVEVVALAAVLRARAGRRRPARPGPADRGGAAVSPSASVDELVEAIGATLVDLHRAHGVRYGSRTWVVDVLPALGPEPADHELARDLLAVSGLVAAGVGPDVTALLAAHPLERLASTAASLHEALAELGARLGAGTGPGGLPAFEAVRWGA